MGHFRNKAIETELRRVLYSLMKGAHCTKSMCPAGPSSSGLILLPFPQLGLCQWPTGCSIPGCAFFPSSCLQLWGCPLQKESWACRPCARPPLLRPSLLSWMMRVLPSGRVRNKQPVHRQLHRVAVQEARKEWALTRSSCSALCTGASPAATPKKSRLLHSR